MDWCLELTEHNTYEDVAICVEALVIVVVAAIHGFVSHGDNPRLARTILWLVRFLQRRRARIDRRGSSPAYLQVLLEPFVLVDNLFEAEFEIVVEFRRESNDMHRTNIETARRQFNALLRSRHRSVRVTCRNDWHRHRTYPMTMAY